MNTQDKHSDSTDDDTSVKNGHRPTAASVKQDAKRAASQAADMLNATEEKAKAALDAAEQAAKESVDELKERLAPADHWLRTTTREHPYMVVGSAVGLSFLAGFLMRRRAAVGAGAAVGFLAGCIISHRPTGSGKAVGEGG